MKYDWLVAGAGFTGAVFARCRAERGDRVLVVDRRDHPGGNAHDAHDEHGILVHVYGPHLFHTNSERVWNWLSRFTEWHPYQHRVLGRVDGQWVPVPFNLTALERLFPPGRAARLEALLLEAYGAEARVPILRLREHPDGEIRELADYVYRKVFEGYTRKQWGLSPEELDPSVTGRVPVLVSRDDRYFRDTWQAVPREGYTALFRRMLDHPRIQVSLSADVREMAASVAHDRLFYTGRIDEYFGFRLGPLPYRSLAFRSEHLPLDRFQEVAQQNYPGDEPQTRISEWKHITGQAAPGRTTITYEFPQAHVEGENEPYYPIPRPANRELYQRYERLAAGEAAGVLFAGRLGDYVYYNMDQAAARAMALADRA